MFPKRISNYALLIKYRMGKNFFNKIIFNKIKLKKNEFGNSCPVNTGETRAKLVCQEKNKV